MSARDYALFELDQRPLPGWPARLLRWRGMQPPADPRDRALAEQILIGVIKNQLHLRFLIAQYSARPLQNVDPLLQKVLAVALYQIRFLARIPASAAVNEAVNQARRFGRSSAAGFVNALLRNATRREPALPRRGDDPAAYAEHVLSHPPELFAKLSTLLGVEQALGLCEHDNLEPPTIVRLFAGAAASALQALGVVIRPHEQEGLYVAEGAKVPLLADWAARGIAQVQDATAARIVPEMRIEPGQRLLDRCAGLGTKTLQMRDALGSEGSILATDPSQPRCRQLMQVLEQRGLVNVLVRPVGRLTDLRPGEVEGFDRILVDAPCSNSGVLARRPEARYAQQHEPLASLASLQALILDDTAPALLPGGLLVYSTCSIWPEENERQVEAFLSRRPDYRPLRQWSVLPALERADQRYRDGGYCAVLERIR